MTDTSKSTVVRDVGVCWSTFRKLDLPAFIEVAASSGFTTLEISPTQWYEARAKGHKPEAIRSRIAALGMHTATLNSLIAPFADAPPLNDLPDWGRDLYKLTEEQCLDAAVALGTGMLAIAHWRGLDVPPAVLVKRFKSLCRNAGARGLKVLIEFMPVGSVPDLDAALDIIKAAGSPANGGLLLDTWHFYRTGGRPEDIARIPKGRIFALELNDAPAALVGIARGLPSGHWRNDRPENQVMDRLMPGEGAIPLVNIIRAARANTPDLEIALEVFSDANDLLQPLDVGRRAVEATRQVLAAV